METVSLNLVTWGLALVTPFGACFVFDRSILRIYGRGLDLQRCVWISKVLYFWTWREKSLLYPKHPPNYSKGFWAKSLFQYNTALSLFGKRGSVLAAKPASCCFCSGAICGCKLALYSHLRIGRQGCYTTQTTLLSPSALQWHFFGLDHNLETLPFSPNWGVLASYP